MNETKKQILELLEENARISLEDMSQTLNMSKDLVQNLISELEKEKIILKYKVVIDRDKVNETVEAVIEVRVVPERDYGFDKVAERICNFPEVRNVFLLSGDYDLMVSVQGKSLKEVASFVSEKLSTLPNVKSTATRFMLKKFKEDNVSFVKKHQTKRLSVSP